MRGLKRLCGGGGVFGRDSAWAFGLYMVFFVWVFVSRLVLSAGGGDSVWIGELVA